MFCKRCRYNLKMIQSGSCPECGRAFDAGNPKTYRRNVGWPKGVRRCLQGMGVFFVFVLIALGVNEVRYQREVAAALSFEKVGARVGWSNEAHQWAKPIPFLHERLQHVHILNPSHNQLTTLPPDLWQLTNLGVLNLNENKLTSIPPGMSKFKRLYVLSINNNQLATLPPDLGKLTKLKTLRLGDNELASLPDTFGELKNLNLLEVNSNRLKSLPPAIGKLTNLKRLDVSDNELATLPSEISNLSSLEWLDLEDNPITDADLNHLKTMLNLRALNVTRTRVTKQGVAALRLALPNCVIMSDFDQPTP